MKLSMILAGTHFITSLEIVSVYFVLFAAHSQFNWKTLGGRSEGHCVWPDIRVLLIVYITISGT